MSAPETSPAFPNHEFWPLFAFSPPFCRRVFVCVKKSTLVQVAMVQGKGSDHFQGQTLNSVFLKRLRHTTATAPAAILFSLEKQKISPQATQDLCHPSTKLRAQGA